MPVLDSALTRTPAQSSAVLKTEIPTKSVLLQQKSGGRKPAGGVFFVNLQPFATAAKGLVNGQEIRDNVGRLRYARNY